MMIFFFKKIREMSEALEGFAIAAQNMIGVIRKCERKWHRVIGHILLIQFKSLLYE